MAHAHAIVRRVRLHRRRYASSPFVPKEYQPRGSGSRRSGLWLHAQGWKARWFGCHMPQVRVQPGYRRNHSLQFHHCCIPLSAIVVLALHHWPPEFACAHSPSARATAEQSATWRVLYHRNPTAIPNVGHCRAGLQEVLRVIVTALPDQPENLVLSNC